MHTHVHTQYQQCTATMGSTDLWRPLRSLQLLSDADAPLIGTDTTTLPPRSVFIISDGHMTEEDPTLSAIRQGVRNSRVFTFCVRYIKVCAICFVSTLCTIAL